MRLDDFIQILHSNLRRKILNLLVISKEMSSKEIYQQLKKTEGIRYESSVYKALDALEKKGLIKKTYSPSRKIFLYSLSNNSNYYLVDLKKSEVKPIEKK